MLDIYNKYSNRKGKEELIYSRFVNKELDSDDEGLKGMRADKKIETLPRLREWITNEIIKNKIKEDEILLDIFENPISIKDHINFNFGFQRMSLPRKLASLNHPNAVVYGLELSIFNIAYEDISGKNLLDYYLIP